MAVLKIHSDITNEQDRQVMLSWFGVDGVSYDTIDSFLSSIPEDDNTIELNIHCRGGECLEGWAIYDKLRSTGKTIFAKIEGKCASMASVILLAAPKENRSAYPNASLLIHDPFYPSYSISEETRSADLRELADNLDAETTKIVNIYVERTGTDEEILRALMKEEKYIDMEKAKELGFISKIEAPISAKDNIHTKVNKMSTKKVTVAEAFNMLGVALGIKKPEAVNMELQTASGNTLTVEREDGDPQVGDSASPDGEHLMPDGKTIVVVDGKITEIKDPDTGGGESEELTQAKNRIAELEAEIATLKTQAKSKKDLDVLNAVATMGGIEKLKTIASNYKPDGRAFAGGKAGGEEGGQGSKEDRLVAKFAAKRSNNFLK